MPSEGGHRRKYHSTYLVLSFLPRPLTEELSICEVSPYCWALGSGARNAVVVGRIN